MGRSRRSWRHVEPHDFPEGNFWRRFLRRTVSSVARCWHIGDRCVLGTRRDRHQQCSRHSPPGVRRQQRNRRLRVDRGLAATRSRHRRHRFSCASPSRAHQSAEPLHQDSWNRRRPPSDQSDDLRRCERQCHTPLLARALSRSNGGIHFRTRST